MDLPSNNDTYHEMYHALNMNLSSKNFEDGHISTGTIFFDTESNKWYLCVSAACDLVPTQGNDPHHVRLSPHRLIKFWSFLTPVRVKHCHLLNIRNIYM